MENSTERCGVCGSRALRTDAVAPPDGDGGWLLLAECPRCDHRWTAAEPRPAVAPLRVDARPLPEVASAA